MTKILIDIFVYKEHALKDATIVDILPKEIDGYGIWTYEEEYGDFDDEIILYSDYIFPDNQRYSFSLILNKDFPALWWKDFRFICDDLYIDTQNKFFYFYESFNNSIVQNEELHLKFVSCLNKMFYDIGYSLYRIIDADIIYEDDDVDYLDDESEDY